MGKPNTSRTTRTGGTNPAATDPDGTIQSVNQPPTEPTVTAEPAPTEPPVTAASPATTENAAPADGLTPAVAVAEASARDYERRSRAARNRREA